MYNINTLFYRLLLIYSIVTGVSLSSTFRAFRFEQWSTLAHTVGSVLLGASIAFLMEVSEFLVVSLTSSLTLSIAGIAKVSKLLISIHELKLLWSCKQILYFLSY